jgi:hypothetical protein
MKSILQLFAAACLVLAPSFSIAQEIEPGSIPALDSDEGIVLFDIDIDSYVDFISLDKQQSIFGFPKLKSLAPGRYTKVIKLKAGEYQFDRFDAGFLYWKFDDVRNRSFRVEANKINYVGEVQSRQTGWAHRSLTIENSGMHAALNLDRNYPGLIKKFGWRYAGEFPDPFMQTDVLQTASAKQSVDAVIESKIEDRDAAELYFRRSTQSGLGLSPNGRYVLEQISEGSNIALHIIDLDLNKRSVIYTGVMPKRVDWVNDKILAITASDAITITRLIEVQSIENIKPIALEFGWIAGIIPNSTKAILVDGQLREVDLSGKLDRKNIRKSPILAKGLRLNDWWIDGKGGLRLVELRRASKQEYSTFVYFNPSDGTKQKFQIPDEKNNTFYIAGFGANSEILAITDRDRDQKELVEIDGKTGAIKRTVKALANTDINGARWGTNHQVASITYLSKGREFSHPLERT